MGRQKKATVKNYQIKISANALRNIDEITGYIAFINLQPLNAVKAGDSIFETIDRIARNPLLFRECAELPTRNKIYRQAVCFNWLIIFRVKEIEILILGIIHGSRRPGKIKKLRRVK